jgi:hypothetical protein
MSVAGGVPKAVGAALHGCEALQPKGERCWRSAEFLGESDEKPFRPADVAEPIRVFIPDDLAYELGSALTEPLERLVDVVDGEHDAQVA